MVMIKSFPSQHQDHPTSMDNDEWTDHDDSMYEKSSLHDDKPNKALNIKNYYVMKIVMKSSFKL